MSRRIAFVSLVSFASISLANSGCELVNKFEGWTPPEGSTAGRGNTAGSAGTIGNIANPASAGNLGNLGSAGSVGVFAPVGTDLTNASGAPALDGSTGGMVAGNANTGLVNPSLGGEPSSIGASGAAGIVIAGTSSVGQGGAVTVGQGGQPLGVGGSESAGRSSGDGGTGPKNVGGSVTQVGGATASGGAASGGTNASGGTAAGGAPSGGTTGTTAACTNEGCTCTGTATIACNDCGTRACNQTTHLWGACSATQSPAATQCANSTTLQTCGSDGKWVSSTCTNADPTHCTVSCVTGTSSSTCVVAALDADSDGHKTKLCATAPGDDCDDGNRNVYPGAVEVCDGVDNDCNGKADLKDGLPLGGTIQTTTDPHYERITWSPTRQRFAVIGWGGGSPVVGPVFGSLSTTGVASWNSTGLDVKTNEHTEIAQLAWLPTSNKFVLLTSLSGRDTYHGTFLYDMDDQGVASGSGATSPVSDTNSSISVRANGDALLAFAGRDNSNSPSIFVGRYTGGTTIPAVTVVGESAVDPRIVTSGDMSAVIYQVSDTKTINWFRVNASLNASTPVPLTSAGQRPVAATVSGNYAVAWLTTSGFVYQVMTSTDGSIVCGPTNVPFGDGVMDWYDEIAIATTQYGTLVFAADVGGKEARLFRMDGSCSLADSILAGNAADAAIRPNIAVGGGYVALTWQNRAVSSTDYTRVMGERLCN